MVIQSKVNLQDNIIGTENAERINDYFINNEKSKEKHVAKIGTDYSYKHEYILSAIIIHFLLQCAGVYGFFFISLLQWRSLAVGLFFHCISGVGSTIAAHRFYAHKSFKAKFGLRLIFMMCHTISGQNSLHTWVRDHRLHHKYSDTDADPHNSNRGFFFSHMGWLMARKHPEVLAKGKQIDMSDLQTDPIVLFQKKYFIPLYLLLSIGLPVGMPVIFFNESLHNAFFVNYVFRYILSLHITWLVNSYAHFFGTRPYDRNLRPADSWFVTFMSAGEGWHNYHHVFPWDYRAGELGYRWNVAALLIQCCAHLGIAYDLKSAPSHMVKQRMIRTGIEHQSS